LDIHSEQNPLNKEHGSLPTEYCSLMKKSSDFYIIDHTPLSILCMHVSYLTPCLFSLFFIVWWLYLYRCQNVGIITTLVVMSQLAKGFNA
jgi:hypothetical protein